MTRGQPRAQVETDPGLIARKLQFLFDTVQKPDGSRYTYREVIDGIQARGGPKISAGYLSQLVTGIRSRPMMDTVQGLARFFDVPVTYFSPDEETTTADDDVELAAALRAVGVQDLALRAAGLNKANLKLVLGLVEGLRDQQGMPSDRAGTAGPRQRD